MPNGMIIFSDRTSAEDMHDPPPRALLWLARGLALTAAGLAAYLLWVTPAGSKTAGCGDVPGIACANVLDSRWSRWLGLPVSLPALVVYAFAFLSLLAVGRQSCAQTQRDAWRLLLPLGALMSGAAVWFIALQALVLRSFCTYCLAAHACGLLLAGFAFWYSPVRWRRARTQDAVGRDTIPARAAWALLLLGFAGPALLAGGQVLVAPASGGMQVVDVPTPAQPALDQEKTFPEKASPPIEPRTADLYVAIKPTAGSPEPQPPSRPKPASPKPTSVQVERPQREPPKATAAPLQRQITILQGQIKLDVYEHPCQGSPKTGHVVVALFDYTCKHCRTVHRYPKQARERYGDQLVIVLLPMPLNPRCNKYVNTSRPEHEHACEFARLALAVWKTKPAAFATFHDWVFEHDEMPTPAAAKSYAAELIGAAALESAMADSDLDRRIEANGRIYSLSGEDRILPRLITQTSIAAGEPKSAQFLFDYLETKLGLKPQVSSPLTP